MRLLAWARNRSFWTIDKARGGEIAQAYREIAEIDKMDSSDPRIQDHAEKALNALIEKACNETRYYKQYNGLSLRNFPVINKNTIRKDQNLFISCKYKKNKLIKMPTSGSTGTPFICYQCTEKKKRVNAEIVYYSEKAGYSLGDNLSYIRTIVKQNKKSIIKQFLQNQTLINCMSLDDKGIELILSDVKKKSKFGKVTLLAYGSTYTAIKNYVIKKHISRIQDTNVCGVISGSDMLFDETREVISSSFGNVPVVSRYSNEENGVLGQDEGINNVFPINEANYIIEICDDDGNPVADGIFGHIVVTDLYNFAMPMIRYDTGDMGSIRLFDLNGRKKRCICDFSGRKVDVIFNTKGVPLSPHAITNYMWSFTDVNQFQVIQTGKKSYTVKLNISELFSRKDELENVLHQLIGEDADISIIEVDEIPVLASGKRRYIVNEMEKL